MADKKKRLPAVVEFGINSPQAERKRYLRRKKRLALEGIDLDAMLKAKKEQKKRLREKAKSQTKKGAKKNASAVETTDKG